MVEIKTIKSIEAPNVTIPMKWIDKDNVERLWTNSGWVNRGLSEEEKTKLSGIEAEANKTIIVDNVTSTATTSALSANQGKVLKAAIDTKQNKLTTGDGILIDNNKISVKFSSGITDIVLVDVLPNEGDREDNVLYLVKED